MFLCQAPEELLDTLKDLQSCVDKAQEKASKKKKKRKNQGSVPWSDGAPLSCLTRVSQVVEENHSYFLLHCADSGPTEEPEWAEVMVDILLSLLSQPSRHVRQVCKTVFSSICPHVTAPALTAILDVSNKYKLFSSNYKHQVQT